MKAVSGVDGIFLHLETEQTPMHVAALHRFELRPGQEQRFYAALKRQLQRRLELAPALARQLAPQPLQFANPVWIAATPDLDYHLQRQRLPPPGDQAQLEDCAAQLHAQRLDRSRPLWRMTVIEGLPPGEVALYCQIHHAMLDGQAGVQLTQTLFDTVARPRRSAAAAATPIERRSEAPSKAELASAALQHDAGQYLKLLRHLPELLRTLSDLAGGAPAKTGRRRAQGRFFGPRTALNVPIDAERSFAGWSVPLATLRRLAEPHGATLNDMVLALCSGALRRWLARHGGIPRRPLIATMPVSLREAGNTEFRTQATLTLVNLHSHVADPLRRLRAIRDAAGATKAMTQRAKGVLPTDFPSIGTPWLLQALAALYGLPGLASAIPPIANLVISNIPGPPQPLYAAGARMRDYWPLTIVEHGVGLNITVISYAGAMGFGITSASRAMPDAREFSGALQAALDELLSLTPT